MRDEAFIWCNSLHLGSIPFGSLSKGERFTFPSFPTDICQKTGNSWYKSQRGNRFRTGKGTSVYLVVTP